MQNRYLTSLSPPSEITHPEPSATRGVFRGAEQSSVEPLRPTEGGDPERFLSSCERRSSNSLKKISGISLEEY